MTLTPRQRAVARLVTMAQSNKQIERSLCLSPRRVERLLSAIVFKWELSRGGNIRVQIARRYLEEFGATDLIEKAS